MSMNVVSRVTRATCLLAVVFPLLAGCGARHIVAVNKYAAISQEFRIRVDKYLELHKRLEGNLPVLKNNADQAQIAAHRVALANAIREARPNAEKGDILFPAARHQIVRIIRTELKGPDGAKVRAAIMVGNPKVEKTAAKIRLSVNALYPDNAPLSTVPPGLLLKLPQLPEQLDYRFVGRDLILRDATTNLIVDYIREAVPKA